LSSIKSVFISKPFGIRQELSFKTFLELISSDLLFYIFFIILFLFLLNLTSPNKILRKIISLILLIFYLTNFSFKLCILIFKIFVINTSQAETYDLKILSLSIFYPSTFILTKKDLDSFSYFFKIYNSVKNITCSDTSGNNSQFKDKENYSDEYQEEYENHAEAINSVHFKSKSELDPDCISGKVPDIAQTLRKNSETSYTYKNRYQHEMNETFLHTLLMESPSDNKDTVGSNQYMDQNSDQINNLVENNSDKSVAESLNKIENNQEKSNYENDNILKKNSSDNDNNKKTKVPKFNFDEIKKEEEEHHFVQNLKKENIETEILLESKNNKNSKKTKVEFNKRRNLTIDVDNISGEKKNLKSITKKVTLFQKVKK